MTNAIGWAEPYTQNEADVAAAARQQVGTCHPSSPGACAAAWQWPEVLLLSYLPPVSAGEHSMSGCKLWFTQRLLAYHGHLAWPLLLTMLSPSWAVHILTPCTLETGP